MTLLEDESAGQRVGYRDFDGFGKWYTYQRQRLTGRSASPHTVRTKCVHLASAANILGVSEEVLLGKQLGERRAVVRLLGVLASRMSPGAMRQAVYALRHFGEYAVDMGYAGSCEVYADDIPPKNPPKPITVYTDDEMLLFVTAARAKGLRWWALMAFLAETGRRVGEALTLEWDWLRQTAGVTYFELPNTKNGEPQYVPLTPMLRKKVFTPENVEALKIINRKGRMAFTRDPALHPFPWSYTTVHNVFAGFCENLGVPNRGFHNFRHTVITNRLAAGMPLQAVSRLAGHSSSAITDLRYNHASALHFAHLLEDGDGEA